MLQLRCTFIPRKHRSLSSNPPRCENLLGEASKALKMTTLPAPLETDAEGRNYMDNLAPAISPPSGFGASKPTHQAVLDWVQEVARLTEPKNIFWCDGSEKENDYLLEQAQRLGVLIKLNQEKNPGSYLHRSNQNDVA